MLSESQVANIIGNADDEMVSRVLEPIDPQRLDNVACFDFKSKCYTVEQRLSHMTHHFSRIGHLVSSVQSQPSPLQEESENSVMVANEPGQEVISNNMRNQFECNDRLNQTSIEPVCQRGFATHPPATGEHNMSVNLSSVYDAYLDAFGNKESRVCNKSVDPIYSSEMEDCSKLMERIVNLNEDREVFADYKYYEDKSDDYRSTGSLLPLWKFVNEKNKKLGLQVTCLRWNPRYPDLFAVAYGSYEFMKQTLGMVAVYSLKNCSSPEILLQSPESTICCLDWNKEVPALLVAGLYDGSVAVLDVRNKNATKFLFQSNVADNKHLDPVWEVLWTGRESFKSVSVDGRISHWQVTPKKLVCETLVDAIKDDPAPLAGTSNALCFDFSPFDTDKFLVGSEEGKIHLCIKYLNSQTQTWVHADKMAVYAIKWNPVHAEMFASAAADWSVKLWSLKENTNCLCVFELGAAVGDLAWWNGFVFAAVTAEGNIFVYDIEKNRNQEICCQKVVKGKLTRIALRNATILVGDDHGVACCLKMSPNLRNAKATRMLSNDSIEEQISRLDAIMKLLS